jgi:hypothetical protein
LIVWVGGPLLAGAAAIATAAGLLWVLASLIAAEGAAVISAAAVL